METTKTIIQLSDINQDRLSEILRDTVLKKRINFSEGIIKKYDNETEIYSSILSSFCYYSYFSDSPLDYRFLTKEELEYFKKYVGKKFDWFDNKQESNDYESLVSKFKAEMVTIFKYFIMNRGFRKRNWVKVKEYNDEKVLINEYLLFVLWEKNEVV